MRTRLALILAAVAIPAVALLGGSSPPAAAGSPAGGSPTRVLAQASTSASEELAQRYSPVLKVRAQHEPCGSGEPFRPFDVDRIMGNDEVALTGPWGPDRLVKVAPTADDLSRGLPGYHLDFPGDPLNPGCTYEEFFDRIAGGSQSTVYARVVTQRGHEGTLALQYWFFYVYNDYNNKHEGDWEMIQLDFDATDARQALESAPVDVGYSQHEGAERAGWGDDKLELASGTHPVVYPAEGSHANFYQPSLYLGRSGEQGVGCDDTQPPHRTLEPRVLLIPTGEDRAVAAYPWLGYLGRWGEQREAFYNGPTGPNQKLQWTEPVTWSETTWRDASFPVPLDSSMGTSATTLFCGAVSKGSDLLRALVTTPTLVATTLLALILLVLWASARTRWSPADARPLVRERAWGQMMVAARRTYGGRPTVFAGIGMAYLATAVVSTAAQVVLFRATGLSAFREVAGSTDGYVVGIVLAIGTLVSLLTFVVVLAATAFALARIDAGDDVTARSALTDALRRLGPLAGVTAVVVPAVVLLSLTLATLPVAVVLLVRWFWSVQVVVIEGLGARAALRRSRELVRGHWWRAAAILAFVGGIGALTGPVVGVALLFVTTASFTFINAVAALVYAVTIPYVALVLTLLYGDLRQSTDQHEVQPE